MSSKIVLTDLVEEVLANVVRQAGVLSLHQLIKIGNRLLSSKLCSLRGVTYYSNLTQYGYPSLWSNNLLLQFKGLKKLNLVTGDISGFKLVSSPILLNSLPRTLEEIYIEAQEVLESCYMTSSGEFPFDFNARFPNLYSLSLLYPGINENAVKLLTITGGAKLRQKWLADHVAVFPSKLTCLETNWPFKDLNNYSELLPPHLQTLTFSADSIEGCTWISVLPLLQNLKILHLKNWKIVEVDESTDKKVESPLCLKRLELPDLNRAHPVNRLFSYLAPKLEELIAPNWGVNMNEASVLTELRKLECLLSFDPSDVQHLQYPPSLVDLRLKSPGTSIKLGQWLATLPSSLTRFECAQCVLSSDFAKLLPSTLTHLVVGAIDKDFSTFTTHLPALIHLEEVGNTSSQLSGSTKLSHDISQLNQLPASIKVLISGYHVLIRSNTLEKSIPCSNSSKPSGWTHIANACKNVDYDEIDRCLMAIGANDPNGVWMRQIVQEISNFPTSLLNWLAYRGVLSNPPQIGSIARSPLIKEASDSVNSSIIFWAFENYPKMFPLLLQSLAHQRCLPVLKQLQETMPLHVEPFVGCNAVATALLAHEYELAQFFRDAGIDFITHFGDVLDAMFENENAHMAEMVSKLKSLKINRVYFDTPNEPVSSRSLMEALVVRIRYDNLTPSLVKLLDYMVVGLGMDINEEFHDPDNPNISCLMDLITIDAREVSLESEYYREMVSWMLSRGFNLKTIPAVAKNGTPYTTSLLVIALQKNNLELMKAAHLEGFSHFDLNNAQRIDTNVPHSSTPICLEFYEFMRLENKRLLRTRPKYGPSFRGKSK